MECVFRLLDPRTQLPFHWQGPEPFRTYGIPLNESGLKLYLDNRASLGITLFIPTGDREALSKAIPWWQENLPFRMSPKHWTTWSPTKVGTFKGRKIALDSLLT